MSDMFEDVIELDDGIPPSGSKDTSDVQDIITRSIEEAVAHFEEHIEPDMTEATDYYYGRPFGEEEGGRSSVVSTDLRDATLDQIPDLMEIFMGSDSVVEFRPRSAAKAAIAEQATDYVNYILEVVVGGGGEDRRAEHVRPLHGGGRVPRI
jgi:hypothetical protein